MEERAAASATTTTTTTPMNRNSATSYAAMALPPPPPPELIRFVENDLQALVPIAQGAYNALHELSQYYATLREWTEKMAAQGYKPPLPPTMPALPTASEPALLSARKSLPATKEPAPKPVSKDSNPEIIALRETIKGYESRLRLLEISTSDGTMKEIRKRFNRKPAPVRETYQRLFDKWYNATMTLRELERPGVLEREARLKEERANSKKGST